jgi:hypothetical protein
VSKHVIWIGEQFCDCNPNAGITNSSHNFWSTFKSTQPDYTFNTIFIDEGNIDQRLQEYCNNNLVDIILCTLLGNSSLNPSIELLEKFKNEGKKVCLIFPDTGPDPSFGLATIIKIGDKVNLHVSFDYPAGKHINEYSVLPNHIFTFTPEDEMIYYPEEKTIDISFLGTKCYQDRYYYLSNLINRYQNMVISGGQREHKLSIEDYSRIIRKSKIGINFSLSPTMQFHQLKGRTIEYIMSKSLLLESKNPCTRTFFTPDEDYIEFNGLQDLYNKIDYYLINENEREKIALNGYNKYKQNWTAAHFWKMLLDELNKR